MIVNAKTGKRKRVYPHADYQAPYHKFKSLKDPQQYLRLGVTFAALNRIAYTCSDTDFAAPMNTAKATLFSTFHS